MAEELTLSTPETKPAVTNNSYQVIFTTFDWVGQTIVINVRGQNGEMIYTGYGGPMATQAEKDEATKLMRTLNTANLSTKSMQKRILEKLVADGKVPSGTVTGTPDPVTP
jgi:hypothetical protein